MVKYREQELFPSEPRKKVSDEERLVKVYVEALRIVDGLDARTLREVFNECRTVKHSIDKKVYLLRALPSHMMDVIQYTALEECITRKLYPNLEPAASIPFAYDEAKAIFEKQK